MSELKTTPLDISKNEFTHTGREFIDYNAEEGTKIHESMIIIKTT